MHKGMVMPGRLRAQAIKSFSEELFGDSLRIQTSYLFQQSVPEFRPYKILAGGKKRTKTKSPFNSISISIG